MTCKHENCSITEYLTEKVTRRIVGGNPADPYQHKDYETRSCDFLSRVRVRCADCGLDKDYSRARIPAWLRQYMDILDI